MSYKTETPSRVLCQLHPNVDYKHAWGCPECVAELRRELTQAKADLLLVNQAANEADAKWAELYFEWREVADRLAAELRRVQGFLGEVDYPITQALLDAYDTLAKTCEPRFEARVKHCKEVPSTIGAWD